MVVDLPNNENHDVSILLRYQGPAVDDGTMDVYDAAANMVAFSDFVVAAAHQLYGKDVQVKAEVNAFARGSFETDLLFQVIGLGASVLAVDPGLAGVTAVVNVVNESLGLFKFLEGKPPAKIEHRDDRSVNVTNNNGNITTVNIESLNVTLDPNAGKAAGKFVGEALSKPGVNAVNLSSDGKEGASATKDEARYFLPITGEETVVEEVVRLGLVIETLSFKEGKKWQMSDGDASISAAMEDEDFIAHVNSGAPFHKGDILICDVRVTQTKVGRALKIQRAIIKVHDHQVQPEQPDLNLASHPHE